MTRVESFGFRPEVLPSKEGLTVAFGGIEIVGKAGTGKTSTARILADLYGIPKERIVLTGQFFRQITGGSSGFMERHLSVDEQLDEMQRQLILGASPQNPFILEGRLAGVIAREEYDKNPSLRVPSFLFVAPAETRMRRLLGRTLEERDKEIGKLQTKAETAPSPEIVAELFERITALKLQDINLKTVKQNERDREVGDLEQWRQLHPQLEGVDLFNPANRDTKGRKIYDFVINTGRLSKAEVAVEVHRILLEEGYVGKAA